MSGKLKGDANTEIKQDNTMYRPYTIVKYISLTYVCQTILQDYLNLQMIFQLANISSSSTVLGSMPDQQSQQLVPRYQFCYSNYLAILN